MAAVSEMVRRVPNGGGLEISDFDYNRIRSALATHTVSKRSHPMMTIYASISKELYSALYVKESDLKKPWTGRY